ncbi:MAG: ATPase [Actinomycetia bacterium]|jgi:uncharacterized protein YndB with AHSA1/START domain|nr:ATPase [Actinomycetes bacterium]MDQ1656731.1 hypothetical protein [Cryptosporangiaceae bacterium]
MAAATSNGTATLTLPSDTQILVVREFNAPRHLVYRAWTEPELVKRWWHAKRGTVSSAEMDVRPGGHWRWAMVATGGFEVAFHGDYREVVPAEKLVYTEAFEGVPDPDGNASLVSITFAGSGGRTTLTMLIEQGTQEGRDMIIQSGMEAGLQDALDLLEEIAVTLS